MIVEVPVYIAIDTQGRPQYGKEHPVAEENFLIRFDTEKNDEPIEFAKIYGKKTGTWWKDTGDVFALLLGNGEYKALLRRIEAFPEAYAPQVST